MSEPCCCDISSINHLQAGQANFKKAVTTHQYRSLLKMRIFLTDSEKSEICSRALYMFLKHINNMWLYDLLLIVLLPLLLSSTANHKKIFSPKGTATEKHFGCKLNILGGFLYDTSKSRSLFAVLHCWLLIHNVRY